MGRPRIRAAFGAAFLLAVSCLPASAGLVTLEAVEDTSFGTPDWSSPVTIQQPVALSARAGPFRVSNLTTRETDLVAWCIDLTQSFSIAPARYQTGLQLVSNERLNLLDRLFTQYFPSVSDALTGAAMQIAIWEIVTETDRTTPAQPLNLDVHTGGFVVAVDTPTNLANSWLSQIARDTTAGDFVFDFFKSDTYQDLMIASSSPTAPIPLPAAAWMLLTAVGGAAGLRKLRKSA